MADNENPQRDPTSPEDNPFIAFRRFADSQVSSLLNTVFTMPATIANYHAAHQAREKCLFGKADEGECDVLYGLEAEMARRRHKGTELFQSGDLQAGLRNSEALMELDGMANELRRHIVGNSARINEQHAEKSEDAALVEKIANAKGQEWGWSWDWGFPRPFDHDKQYPRAAPDEISARDLHTLDKLLELHAEARDLVGEEEYNEAIAAATKMMPESYRAHFRGRSMQDMMTELERQVLFTLHQAEAEATAGEKRLSSPWQWPTPADAARPTHDPYAEFIRAEQSNQPHCMRTQNPPLTRSSQSGPEWRMQNPKWNREKPGGPNNTRYLPLPAEAGLGSHDEPSYEYSHDHEDQHDEPPSPKTGRGVDSGCHMGRGVLSKYCDFSEEDADRKTTTSLVRDAQRLETAQAESTETELDVYEHVATTSKESAPENSSGSSVDWASSHDVRPSVLSTLTTTERTTAPDGSVTTKVLLKKRFTDGREEISETVNIERGQEAGAFRRKTRETLSKPLPISRENPTNGSGKTRGWFWSS